MNNREKIFYGVFVFVTGVLMVFVFKFTFASSPGDITFPVPELNNCASKQECKTFCDDPRNINACVSFAEQHNLIPSEEAARARKFGFILQTEGGPGGCRTKETCESYCSEVSHIDECSAFAEKHDLAGREKLDEARRISQAVKEGIALPGNCRTKDECEAYCNDSGRAEECLDFAERAGFIRREEAQRFRNVMKLIRVGNTPGNCRTPEECRSYCIDPAHQQECLEFARENGLIPGEQRKEFGKTDGLLDMIEHAPEGFVSCMQSMLGTDLAERLRSGDLMPGPQIMERIKECFEKLPVREPEASSTPRPSRIKTCPLMPTVERCPEGQQKFLMFSSPECGEYYGCKSLERTEKPGLCIQVITPARDPRTGACREFPTPCDVPLGWEKTDKCSQSGSGKLPTPTTILPSIQVPPNIIPCLVSKLGQEVVDLLVRGERFPGEEEIRAFKACFLEGQNSL